MKNEKLKNYEFDLYYYILYILLDYIFIKYENVINFQGVEEKLKNINKILIL